MIDYTGANGLFTRLRELIDVLVASESYSNTQLEPALQAVLGAYGNLSTNNSRYADIQGFVSAIRSQIEQGAIKTAVTTLAGREILYQLQLHNPAIRNLQESIESLYQDMLDEAETIERNVVSVVSTPPNNQKPQILVYSHEGLPDEDYLVTVQNSSSFRIAGRTANSAAPLDWPPTGFSTSLPITRTSNSILSNPGFDLTEAIAANHPDDWNVDTGTIGTTISQTGFSIQNLEITGGPTSGWFTLRVEDLDGNEQLTDVLPHNPTAAEIQAAIVALAGFEGVTVTGVSATEFDVTFNGIAGLVPLMVANDQFDAGGVAVTDVTAANTGGLEAKSLYFTGGAAENTTISQRVTGLAGDTVYGFSIRLRLSAATTGNLRIALVDGAGTIIQDDLGNNLSLSVDVATLGTATFSPHSAFWKTPTNLPAVVKLQLRMTTALAAQNLFFDAAILTAARRLNTRINLLAIAFDGPDPAQIGDSYTLSVTNDYGGRFQSYLFRLFGFLLPSAAVPTIPD